MEKIMAEVLCNELFITIRNSLVVINIIILVSIISMQRYIFLTYIVKNNILYLNIVGPSGKNGYNSDAMGIYGFYIMWRFNRELRKDKETLNACRGMYNVYLSLIAAFVLLSVFLILSFSLCS